MGSTHQGNTINVQYSVKRFEFAVKINQNLEPMKIISNETVENKIETTAISKEKTKH